MQFCDARPLVFFCSIPAECYPVVDDLEIMSCGLAMTICGQETVICHLTTTANDRGMTMRDRAIKLCHTEFNNCDT
jgi:hypothetical protein